MKILVVFTSLNQRGDTGQKAGFWVEELAVPYYVFKNPAWTQRSFSKGWGSLRSIP